MKPSPITLPRWQEAQTRYVLVLGLLVTILYAARAPDPTAYANMRSATSPYARFRRAIATGNLFNAEIAARELPERLPLDDALDLVLLIAAQKPERLPSASLRWHGRLELEAATLTLEEAELDPAEERPSALIAATIALVQACAATARTSTSSSVTVSGTIVGTCSRARFAASSESKMTIARPVLSLRVQ